MTDEISCENFLCLGLPYFASELDSDSRQFIQSKCDSCPGVAEKLLC